MPHEDFYDKLNACSHLHLGSYEETPDTQGLRLVVHEARAERESYRVERKSTELEKVLGKGRTIKSDAAFAEFTITFENYIGFCIRDESFANGEPEEDYSKKLRSYTNSAFLDFMKNSTFAEQCLSQPVLHFAVVCLNHIIDVACVAPPKVTFNSNLEISRSKNIT